MTEHEIQFNLVIEKLEELKKSNNFDKTFLNLKELTGYTGMSSSQIYKLTAGRKIPFYRPTGKLMFFKKTEIDEWISKNRFSTEEEIRENADSFIKNHKRIRH